MPVCIRDDQPVSVSYCKPTFIWETLFHDLSQINCFAVTNIHDQDIKKQSEMRGLVCGKKHMWWQDFANHAEISNMGINVGLQLSSIFCLSVLLLYCTATSIVCLSALYYNSALFTGWAVQWEQYHWGRGGDLQCPRWNDRGSETKVCARPTVQETGCKFTCQSSQLTLLHLLGRTEIGWMSN